MPLLNGKHTCSCARHSHTGFHSKLAPAHFPPNLGLEPKHNRIELDIDVENQSAQGNVRVSVLCNNVGQRNLELDAVNFENLSIIDLSGKKVEFTYDGKKINIHWEDAFTKNELRKIEISYLVRKPIAGLYFSSPENDYSTSGTWAATDHETERARHWLPCIDHLNVRTTLEFILTADSQFEILANGVKQKETIKGDKKTVVWKLDFPCPSYLTCFALGDFSVYEDGEFQNIAVSYFAEKKHLPENLERSFGRTKEMLSWMTKKLGVDFPFPKYFQFALPDIGGAMENISLVSWDDIFVLDELLATEWTWLLDQINVHEMAHSYFGDAVVCRDFAHVWLKESWATYMEICWLEDRYGEDEKQYDLYRSAYGYFEEADGSYQRPIVTRTFDSSWDMFDAHLYPGGACRLHTLRNELGTEVFWEGVKLYIETNMGQVVETSDFRKAMEKVSGRSLVQFFNQWFHTASYPDIEAKFEYDGEKKEGTFTLTQKQVNEKGEYLFQLPLSLAFGKKGEEVSKNIVCDKKVNTYTFAMETDPEVVRIDPEAKVLLKLSFNPGDEKLRTQLSAPDVIGRIYAAKELAKSGGLQNIEALTEAYEKESFWGVKQQLMGALTTMKSANLLPVLLNILSYEKDPMVLEYHYKKVLELKDPAIADIIIGKLKQQNLGHFAKRAALEGLGKMGKDAPLSVLKEGATKEGIHGIAQHGGLVGLANTRRKEALHIIIDQAKESQQFRVRKSAMHAIGKLCDFLEREDRFIAIEFLTKSLRDKDVSVAESAARALCAAKAIETKEDVEQFKARLPHQFQVSLDRSITSMKDPKNEVHSKLSQQLDEVKKEMALLMARIEKLER